MIFGNSVVYCIGELNEISRDEKNHFTSKLILILYCLASIFKTIIDTIFIYSFRNINSYIFLRF